MSSQGLKSGLVEVLLPSGVRVRGSLPTVGTILRRGATIPDRLAAAVLRAYAEPRWLVQAVGTAEDTEQRAIVWRALAASFPREELVDGEWRPVAVSLDELDAGLLAEEDVDALLALVQRVDTPDGISARARFMRGEGPDPEAAQEQEVPADIPGWESFRDGPDVAPAGGDGEALGAAPEPGAGDHGPRGGARGRRGAEPAPEGRGGADGRPDGAPSAR